MCFGKSPDSWVIRSVMGTHFIGAQADGVIDIENLTPADGIPTPHLIISRITVLADQNIAWDISLWKNNDGPQPTTSADTSSIADFVSFVIADGVQFVAASPFIYSLSNMAIRLPTDDGQLFVGVTPRGAAKNAGATGEIVVEIAGPVV